MKKISTLLCVVFMQLGVAKMVVPVESVGIKYGTLSKIESFIGTVRFKEISSVATSAQGVVQGVYFSIGDNVKKGQKLISLDSALLLEDIKIKQAKIADARYTLERQKNELERYKNLLQSQSISIQQYENLEYEIKSQEARIQALLGELAISKVQKDQKVIYAPFDGIIVEQRTHKGEWVQAGAVVCQILNSRDTEVIIDVPSSIARVLNPKQKVKLIIGEREYQGTIFALIPRADTLSRTFPVYISVRNDGSLLDGMAARVFLDILGGREGFIVPRDSIVYENNTAFVFVIRANKAVRLPVKILTTQDSRSLVSGALKADDSLVLRGQDTLSDNTEVRVVNQK